MNMNMKNAGIADFQQKLDQTYKQATESRLNRDFYMHLVRYTSLLFETDFSNAVKDLLYKSYYVTFPEQIGKKIAEEELKEIDDIKYSTELWYCLLRLLSFHYAYKEYPVKAEKPVRVLGFFYDWHGFENLKALGANADINNMLLNNEELRLHSKAEFSLYLDIAHAELAQFSARDARYNRRGHLKKASLNTNDEETKIIVDPAEVKLRHEDYDKNRGILKLTTYAKVDIAKDGNVRKPDGNVYMHCRVMECVFSSVNTMSHGAKFSTILGVNTGHVGLKGAKSIQNAVSYIKSKTQDQSGIKQLILIQDEKVKVNVSYLYKY
jgi:hypothetical protein